MSEGKTPEEIAAAEEAARLAADKKSINEFINEDGSFKEGFYDMLSDDLGQHSHIKRYGNIDDVMKTLVSQRSVISKKVEDLLGSDNEDIQKQIKSLKGIPEKAEDYDYEPPESFVDLPDDLKNKMADYADKQKEIAFKDLNLSKDQFAKLMSRELDQAATEYKERQNAMDQYQQEAEQELKKKWGRDHGENLKRTLDTCVHIGRPEWAERAKNDPKFTAELHESLVPYFEDDTIIEFKQKQDLMTTEEEFNYNHEKMMNFEGDLNSPEYKKLVDKNRKYVEKMN